MGAFELTNIAGANWSADSRHGPLALILACPEELSAALLTHEIGGFAIRTAAVEPDLAIRPEILRHAAAAIVEVRPGETASLQRFRAVVAGRGRTRILAAVRDPSVADVRMLMREGADDVVALPLLHQDLRPTLEHVRGLIATESTPSAEHGRLLSFIKAGGGAGATVIATQAAALLARSQADAGREVCLMDLDMQFGNAATYLGTDTDPSIRDLLEAGARVDGALLRSAVSRHASGLGVIAAPSDIVPLESVDTDLVCDLVDLATREFSTVFLDLPSNWTNWSVSLLARSDIIFLVTGLTVPALRQAARLIDMLEAQGLGGNLRIIANRYEKSMFKPIDVNDAERALRRRIDHLIANEYAIVSAAVDQGMLLSDIKPKSRVSRDLSALLAETQLVAGSAGR